MENREGQPDTQRIKLENLYIQIQRWKQVLQGSDIKACKRKKKDLQQEGYKTWYAHKSTI